MKKEKIKQIVREYVKSIPYQVGDFGIAQHPIFTTFGTINMKTKELVKIDDNNFEMLLEQQLILLDKSIEQKDGLFSMLIRIHKPFRLPLLMKLKEELTIKQYSEALISLWTDTEFPHQNGTKVMLDNFMYADTKYLMTSLEKKKLDNMNDIIVVYRGLQDNAEAKALSWTTEKKTAIWFATRFERKGRVIKANIQKKHIFAYKEERNEAEIILNPNFLRNVKEINYEAEK